MTPESQASPASWSALESTLFRVLRGCGAAIGLGVDHLQIRIRWRSNRIYGVSVLPAMLSDGKNGRCAPIAHTILSIFLVQC